MVSNLESEPWAFVHPTAFATLKEIKSFYFQLTQNHGWIITSYYKYCKQVTVPHVQISQGTKFFVPSLWAQKRRNGGNHKRLEIHSHN